MSEQQLAEVKTLTQEEQVKILNQIHNILGQLKLEVSQAKTVLDVMQAVGHVNNSIVKQIAECKEKGDCCSKVANG